MRRREELSAALCRCNAGYKVAAAAAGLALLLMHALCAQLARASGLQLLKQGVKDAALHCVVARLGARKMQRCRATAWDAPQRLLSAALFVLADLKPT